MPSNQYVDDTTQLEYLWKALWDLGTSSLFASPLRMSDVERRDASDFVVAYLGHKNLDTTMGLRGCE